MSWGGGTGSGWTSLSTNIYDVPSHYSSLRDVPVVLQVSQKIGSVGTVDLARDFRPVNEDVLAANDYDFVFERKFLETMEKDRATEEETRLKREAARAARLEARTRAQTTAEVVNGPSPDLADGPGIRGNNGSQLTNMDLRALESPVERTMTSGSDDQQRSLSRADSGPPDGLRPMSTTPTLDPKRLDGHNNISPTGRFTSSSRADQGSPTPSNTNTAVKRPPDFNFLEFEQGLAPPDPWDVPQDDLSAIGEVLGVSHARPPTLGHGYGRQPQPPAQQQQHQHVPPSIRQTGPVSSQSVSPRPYSQTPPQSQPPSSGGSFSYPSRIDPAPSDRPFTYLPAKAGSPASPSRASPPVPPRPVKSSTMSSPELPEPPNDLTAAQKKTFTAVVSMGFPTDAVARAVRHSSDEKKIVDFTISFAPLMATGLYAAEDIEVALLLFESDYEKAARFLEGSARLREMGFSKGDVQEAMLYKNNDEVSAAEWLLAGKKG